MEDLVGLVIGSAASEHLTLRPLRRSHPGFDDYWDGNWLTCEVFARVGGFTGSVHASLRSEEFVLFRDALQGLRQNLRGTAMFATMEEWVRVVVSGDGLGHFEAACLVRDEPGVGNTLEFLLEFDQTQIPAMVTALDDIVRAFPVVGKR